MCRRLDRLPVRVVADAEPLELLSAAEGPEEVGEESHKGSQPAHKAVHLCGGRVTHCQEAEFGAQRATEAPTAAAIKTNVRIWLKASGGAATRRGKRGPPGEPKERQRRPLKDAETAAPRKANAAICGELCR